MRRLMRIALFVLALELCVLGVLAAMVSQRRVDAMAGHGSLSDQATVTHWCPAGGMCQEEHRTFEAPQTVESPAQQSHASVLDY